MPKRSSTPKATSRASAPPAGALERQVIAFAEQLGYVAGSIEARAEGWMDREKLTKQVTSVRDGARQLLDQLARGVASTMRRAPASKGPARKARSGGTVDAPGKKHRKPAPAGPAAAAARTRNARVGAATPTARMINRRRRQA